MVFGLRSVSARDALIFATLAGMRFDGEVSRTERAPQQERRVYVSLFKEEPRSVVE